MSDALTTLPESEDERWRLAEAWFLSGITAGEIAQRLGKQRGAVYQHMRRGKFVQAKNQAQEMAVQATVTELTNDPRKLNEVLAQKSTRARSHLADVAVSMAETLKEIPVPRKARAFKQYAEGVNTAAAAAEKTFGWEHGDLSGTQIDIHFLAAGPEWLVPPEPEKNVTPTLDAETLAADNAAQP